MTKWKDGNSAKGAQNLLLVYQSDRPFDPTFGEVGSIIKKTDFYATVSAKGLIWENVWEASRKKEVKTDYHAKGGWFCALKWDGSAFRTVAIAVTPTLRRRAYAYIKYCIDNKVNLNLLNEYSFAVHAGNLIQDGTQLTH